MSRRRIGKAGYVLLILLALSLAVTACGQKQPAGKDDKGEDAGNGAAENVIKVGAAVSLSGSGAFMGKETLQGYELWADTVNKQGGIKVGDKSHQVKVISYDDKSDSQTSTKLIEKLITEDGVDFLLAPYGSGPTQATSAISEKYGKIMLAPMANAPSLFERGFKNFFSITVLAENDVALHIPLLETLQPKPKRVAIVAPDDTYPLSSATTIKEVAKAHGFEVVYFEKYPLGTKDLAPILTKIKSLNADALFNTSEVEDAILFFKQAKDLDVNIPYVGLSGPIMSRDFRDALGRDAEYLYGTGIWIAEAQWPDPVFGDSLKFAQLFEATYGNEPEFYGASGAAAGTTLQMAIEKAGTLDTEAVRAALHSLDTTNVYGRVKFDETGRNIAVTSNIIQIRDGGKTEMIWPEEIRTVDPVYPMPKWSER